MANTIMPTRPCAWHTPDGTPCASKTKLVAEEFGGIPVCMKHRSYMAAAILAEVNAEWGRVERERLTIEHEAVQEHIAEGGCDLGAHLAEIEAQRAARKHYVYYMRNGKYVKIGRAYYPPTRLTAIRKGGVVTPEGMDLSETVLERVELAPPERELFRHDQFAHLRVAGEWFVDAPDLERFMAGLGRPEAYFGADV